MPSPAQGRSLPAPTAPAPPQSTAATRSAALRSSMAKRAASLRTVMTQRSGRALRSAEGGLPGARATASRGAGRRRARPIPLARQSRRMRGRQQVACIRIISWARGVGERRRGGENSAPREHTRQKRKTDDARRGALPTWRAARCPRAHQCPGALTRARRLFPRPVRGRDLGSRAAMSAMAFARSSRCDTCSSSSSTNARRALLRRRGRSRWARRDRA